MLALKLLKFKEKLLKHCIDFQYNEWFFLFYFVMNNGFISIFLCNL